MSELEKNPAEKPALYSVHDAAAASPPPPAAPTGRKAPAANEINEDLACVQCGCNLRGLAKDGACPDCNAPVVASLQQHFLRFSDPRWITRIDLAVEILLWGLAAQVVTGMLLNFPPGELMALVGAGLGVWASWLLTTPEPQATPTQSDVTLGRALRTCAVVNAAGSVISTVGRIGDWDFLIYTGLILLLAGAATMWLFCVCMRRLAMRIPDAPLVKSTDRVKWGLAISLGAMLVLGILMDWSDADIFDWLMIPAGLAMLVFGIWWAALLLRYRGLLAGVLVDAQRG
jgi:hypothetical protein